MKKEIIEKVIKNINGKEETVYQVTTTDERWYAIQETNTIDGLPFTKFIPSVTWITSFVYKGIEFYKWLASKGWDEAERIRMEAGDKGSKIHQAIDSLIQGNVVKMDDKLLGAVKDELSELTPEEYKAVNTFVQWYRDFKPEFIANEIIVVSKKYDFAGTIDCVCRIGDQVWIIDWKSSQYIWPSMQAQLSAYKQAFKEMGHKVNDIKLAILQVGYSKNKKGYKFSEVQDCFETLFLPARAFWLSATRNQSPKQYELPLKLSLNLPPKEIPKEEKREEKISQTGDLTNIFSSEEKSFVEEQNKAKPEILKTETNPIKKASISKTKSKSLTAVEAIKKGMSQEEWIKAYGNKAEEVANMLNDSFIFSIPGIEPGTDEGLGALILAQNLRKHFEKHVYSFYGKSSFENASSLDNIKKLFDKKITNYIRRFDNDAERIGAEKYFNYLKEKLSKVKTNAQLIEEWEKVSLRGTIIKVEKKSKKKRLN